MSACVVPRANDAFAGVTVNDTRAAGPTVSCAVPLMPPDVAVIVVTPLPTPVAKPPLLTVAAAGLLELHVADVVRFCVLPSE